MITVDGVEYNEDDLTDEQKYLVNQVRDIETKLGRLSFEADQLNAAKKLFSDTLVQSLKAVED